jgi:hypothetical protein
VIMASEVRHVVDTFQQGDESGSISSAMRLYLRDVDPSVDPIKMQEVMTNHLSRGRQLSSLTPGEQKVLLFRVDLEFEHNIEECLRIYHAQVKAKPYKEVQAALLLQVIEKYANFDFGDESDDEEQSIAPIDRPVATGLLTQLHVAAASGDLDRVVELVEKFGANPLAKDSGGLTPLTRAEMMGQKKVIAYLRSRITKG